MWKLMKRTVGKKVPRDSRGLQKASGFARSFAEASWSLHDPMEGEWVRSRNQAGPQRQMGTRILSARPGREPEAGAGFWPSLEVPGAAPGHVAGR